MSPAMQVRTLKVDDQEIGARADQTILEVAREHSIDIPALCHLDGFRMLARVACVWWKSKARVVCSRRV